MRIAGITWWRNNYGSILQAYALQQYLKETEKVDYVIINQYSKKMVSLDNLIDKIKNVGLISTAKRLIIRFGTKRLRNRVHALQRFVDYNLTVTEKIYNEESIVEANKEFDGFICGSDQIWNPANTALNSMYWLGFVETGKIKIAYAPSIGVTSVSENEAAIIKKNLTTFDAISTREKSGADLINTILGANKCFTVLDPTMLVSRTVWDKISVLKQGKYIFVYILKGTKDERKLIERFSKMVDLPIFTIPFLEGESIVLYDAIFGDKKFWDADPSDFISLIRGAEFVFTDSFHCMVFSCLYHKTFFTFPKKGKHQMSRLIGLQDLLQTGNRMIKKQDTVDSILCKPSINWELVDKILEKNVLTHAIILNQF